MSTTSEAEVVTEREGSVLWITMNRPLQLNALSLSMVEALATIFEKLRGDEEVRVVLLKAEGRSFCAGLDLNEQLHLLGEASPTKKMAMQQRIRDIILAMRRCPQPIVGIIQGSACGGGLAIALACDVRLMTMDARMNAAFIKIGVTGCDVGVSYLLPRLVGASVAAEMMLTGRFLEASCAAALGLASSVGTHEALVEEARTLANEMLATSPLALRMTKEGMNHALDAPSLESAIALEDRQQVICMLGQEFAEGLRAFKEKRPPSYQQSI